MPSSDDTGDSRNGDLDSETEAAVRRAVRDEIRGAVRAVSQIGGGLLVGFVALPAVAGALLVLGAPVGLVLIAAVVALLALAAYGWQLPPFR